MDSNRYVDIEARFSRHTLSEDDVDYSNYIRDSAKNLAHYVSQIFPDGPEKDKAIDKLDEFVMWANAGLARRG